MAEENIIDYIKSLGWKHDRNLFNRAIYSLDDFTIFEHQGEIGYVSDREGFFFCNMTRDEIKQFTDLINEKIKIFSSPKDHTVYDCMQNSMAIGRMIRKFIFPEFKN
jgi:hypothetical protein